MSKKFGLSTREKVVFAAIFLTLWGGGIYYTHFVKSDAPPPETQRLTKEEREIAKNRDRFCRDADMAAIMSRHFVKKHLRAPSTAKFPSYKAQNKGECEFVVVGQVDAQNGFGAMLRSRYSVSMTYHPGTNRWSARNVVIE